MVVWSNLATWTTWTGNKFFAPCKIDWRSYRSEQLASASPMQMLVVVAALGSTSPASSGRRIGPEAALDGLPQQMRCREECNGEP